MAAMIHFKFRACDGDLAIPPSRSERAACPHCKGEVPLFTNESTVDRLVVTMCVSCGHDALYVQKDFNRRAGVAIVGLGVAASLYFFARSQPMFAMAALGLTALADLLAYLMVREVTVCYACHAVYRGF